MADQETVTLTRAQVEELRAIIHNADSPLGNRLQDVSSRLYFALDGAGWTPAATPAAPSVGTASMYAQQHGLAVTTEWMIGWNACLDAIDAAALAQPAPAQQSHDVPDSVWEALQRLIENAASLGPASQDDALLVAQYRDRARFMAAPVQQDAPAPSMVGDAKGGA